MNDFSELKKLAEDANSEFPAKEDLWNMVCTPTVGLELIAEIERLRADFESVDPEFADIERLCRVLGYLGVSTPESGHESAARWLSLVRKLILTAETSKLLRQDAEAIAEYQQLKADNETLRAKYEAARDRKNSIVVLRAENEALREKADCVDDCVHLIRKLVHCRRQLATDGTLAEKALDYLKRKGLQGSPLRGEADHG